MNDDLNEETVDGGSKNPIKRSATLLRLERGRDDTVNDSELQTDESENPQVPPDGGCRAYVVVVASFCTNGLIFGIINSYSVVYLVLLQELQSQNVEHAEVKACKYTITSVYFVLLYIKCASTCNSMRKIRLLSLYSQMFFLFFQNNKLQLCIYI